MKARILELINHPESIVNEDLQLLKEEIAVQPYAQSLRALYLLGVKKYDSTQFQKVLSTTAAFTTDKKVLYQFINGEKYESKIAQIIDNSPAQIVEESEIINNETATSEIIEENSKEANWLAEIPEKKLPKKIVVDGEVNRILFEGEENFLNEVADAKIDIEATKESGVLVTEKIDDVANETVKEPPVLEKSPENFKNDLLTKKSEILQDKTQEYLDKNKEIVEEIIIEKPVEKNQNVADIQTAKPEKTFENKYEIERKKLAEDIERKMSLSKKAPFKSNIDEKMEENNATVDFFQTQEFSIKDKDFEQVSEEKPVDNFAESAGEISKEKEDLENKNATWKPMTESENKSSRFKKIEGSKFLEENVEQRLEKKEAEITFEENTEDEEVAALDISFFTPEISSIKKEDKEDKEEDKVQNSIEVEKSNIPVFINTWQNWLKIDRSEEKIEEKEQISKENKKFEAIEKFIDAAPKISKFKEDNNYIIPEKKDDITHLMTETLANLFWTQKLYSKATSAYKTLIAKHPEKSEYFERKIEEIQASKQK